MEATVVAGLAGLIGLIVGRFWDSRSESRRWRRDKRIRTYEEFAGAYYQVREGCRRLAMLPLGASEMDQVVSDTLDSGIEFNRLVVAIWLHGSASVSAAAGQVDKELIRAFVAARERQYTWDEWRLTRGPAENTLERFIEAVRSELSLPKWPVAISVDLASLRMDASGAS